MSRDQAPPQSLLAVDVGSSRIKLGWFPDGGDQSTRGPSLPAERPRLPAPRDVLAVPHRNQAARRWQAEIQRWLEAGDRQPDACIVAAVDPAVADQLVADVLPGRCDRIVRLTPEKTPLATRVERPEQVGVDRLINAVAAGKLVDPPRSILVIDAGTAVTIDLTAGDGVFQGGAILPGPHTAASALYQSTARLPQIEVEQLDLPPAVGRSTEGAIAAGIYWGAVGAIRQVVARIAAELPDEPAMFLTGGDAGWLEAPLVAALPELRRIEHLTLSGIAVIAPTFA